MERETSNVKREASKYLFRPEELKAGVCPHDGGLHYLSCQRIELDGDHPAVTVQSGLEEVVLVCIGGQVDYDFDGTTGTAQFQDFFYVPWKSKVTVRTEGKAVLMRIGALCDRDTDFVHIPFSDVERDPAKQRHGEFLSQPRPTACSEHVDRLTAMRTDKRTHVLNDPQHRDLDLLEHLSAAQRIPRRHFLRGSDDDCTAQLNRLNQRYLN